MRYIIRSYNEAKLAILAYWYDSTLLNQSLSIRYNKTVSIMALEAKNVDYARN